MYENIFQKNSAGLENILKTILNSLDSSIYIVDMQTYEVLFMNTHMKNFLGQNYTGHICWEKIHQGLSGPCHFCTNDRLVDSDGNPAKPYVWKFHSEKFNRFFELRDQAIRWTDGRLVKMSVARDITGVKKMEELLAESQSRLTFALLGANSGIWDWNLQTGDVFFTESYYKMAGYEPNDFSHSYENWKKRVHPDDIGSIQEKIKAYINGEADSFSAEFRFLTKHGSWIWIHSQGKIFEYDNNGNPVRFTGMHHNIDDWKQAQLKLEKSHETLEKSVKERTAELERMNAALEVLLEKRIKDRSEIENNIITNFKLRLSPTIAYLKKHTTQENICDMISLMESDLENVISPFAKKLLDPIANLTPMEIRIASMVKLGKTNKEISKLLNRSVYTIANHRENIRKKLGIQNKRKNLRAFLLELEK